MGVDESSITEALTIDSIEHTIALLIDCCAVTVDPNGAIAISRNLSTENVHPE